jgi:hypothetical protein
MVTGARWIIDGGPQLASAVAAVPHRDGRIEAQVGRDGKLHSYGVTCENDTPEAQATQGRKAS